MQNFLNSHLRKVVFFIVFLFISNFVFADTATTKQQINLSGLFAKELSKHEDFEIKNKPEYCLSKARPLTMKQELSEMVLFAIQSSENMKSKSECNKVSGEDKYHFCRFYFHSDNKNEQWSVGFNFLGDIASGEIRFDTLECFGTP
jgi:hypothetical protein